MTRTCATCHAVLADGPQPAATYARRHCERCSGSGHEPTCDGACFECRGTGYEPLSDVAECRALIKRIDDLLHDNNSEAAHIDLHELAHRFEQYVAGRHA
jgi:hypothetical protein